jgi:ABC-type uncharacterized transport system auxiliary subunit
MNNSRYAVLACYIVVSYLLGGCLGSRDFTPIRYYSVGALPETVPRATRSWPISLGVRPFTAATRYGDRILYRLSAVEVGFYEYDRWVEPPEEMVTQVLISTVRASALFRQVVSADNVSLPAWLLSGELMRFDEVREEGKSLAECWLRLELRRARDEQLLWSEVIKAAVPLATETPEALAQAMSRAVQQTALQLVTSLHEANLPRP